MFAEEFGWSLEYISSLTHKQVRRIIEGKSELNKLRDSSTKTNASTKRVEKVSGGKIVHEKVSVESFNQLLAMPGAGNAMTPRLKKYLQEKAAQKKSANTVREKDRK